MFTIEMLFTFAFMAVSTMMIFGGWYHCSSNYESTHLSCVHDHCNLELTRNGADFIQYDFEKSAIVSAYVCRMKKGSHLAIRFQTLRVEFNPSLNSVLYQLKY